MQYNYPKNNKSILISGNGPSLRKIDYFRLPKEYDVYRCNQFYFEDKYFTGRNIECAFINIHSIFKSQYNTYCTLKDRDEYKINNIVLNFHPESWAFECRKIIPHDVKNSLLSTGKLEEFMLRMSYISVRYYKRITSTINMLFYAISKGYRDIYIAGVDFYDNFLYGFDNDKKNLISLSAGFSKKIPDALHSKHFDLEGIKLACDLLGCKFFDNDFISVFANKANKIGDGNIYCLSSNIELAKYIPLAPIQNNTKTILESKNNFYINDIIPFIPTTSVVLEEDNEPAIDKNKILVLEMRLSATNFIVKFLLKISRTIRLQNILKKIGIII